MVEETEKVPIERLLTNFTKKHQENTNDLVTVYHLARVHSMAYATALQELQVVKKNGMPSYGYPGSDSGVPKEVAQKSGKEEKLKAHTHLTNAIVFYQRSLNVMKNDKTIDRSDRRSYLLLPLQLGHAWCLDQTGRRDEALAEYRKALKISWAMEIKGDFEFKQWQENRLEEPQLLPEKTGGARRLGGIGPGVFYTGEIMGYMRHLLDPVKDQQELKQLKNLENEFVKLGRVVTPVLIPVGDRSALENLVNPDANVIFDLDGSGIPKKWGWITTNAAWLVYDKESTGRITSGLQMMGNVTFWIFWENGYQPLAALDDNGDGTLTGSELKGFALWHDRNSNGISESGEVRSVQEFGITSISSKHELHKSGIPWNPQGVTLTNGTTLPSYDWIVPGKP